MRDPGREPLPGDRLEKRTLFGRRLVRHVIALSKGLVIYTNSDGSVGQCKLNTWAKWCRKAQLTILFRGD